MKTGIELIAEERARQISKEGYTPAHDDGHTDESLALAAAAYALPVKWREQSIKIGAVNALYLLWEWIWPWGSDCWRPKPEDRIRELVKAGALIVAEIERRQRSVERATKLPKR